MSEKQRELSRIYPKGKHVTPATESYDIVHFIGGGIRPVKTAIWQVYRLLSAHVPITESRVKDLWYGDARISVRADEMDALRRVAAQVKRQKKEAQIAIQGLADAYQGAANRLRAIDPDYHGAEIARLERLVGDISPVDSAGAAPNTLTNSLPDDEGGESG